MLGGGLLHLLLYVSVSTLTLLWGSSDWRWLIPPFKLCSQANTDIYDTVGRLALGGVLAEGQLLHINLNCVQGGSVVEQGLFCIHLHIHLNYWLWLVDA